MAAMKAAEAEKAKAKAKAKAKMSPSGLLGLLFWFAMLCFGH